jgi:hypothetical protein
MVTGASPIPDEAPVTIAKRAISHLLAADTVPKGTVVAMTSYGRP